ncbi:hypothetical protein NPIL_693771 [Nephila pilipes]|uniref:Uncharacterized protein n=1 Tax=Nephila pilipes TaxID=299642 RepID=A0A8X6TPS2_NEPPI|nr:hypothetical protein NPIL_693771 [Nephila pilipes]
MLADKLEAFDNIRRSLPSGPRRHVKASETLNDGKQVTSRKPERLPKRKHSHAFQNERPPFKYYDCGRPGVIRYVKILTRVLHWVITGVLATDNEVDLTFDSRYSARNDPISQFEKISALFLVQSLFSGFNGLLFLKIWIPFSSTV